MDPSDDPSFHRRRWPRLLAVVGLVLMLGAGVAVYVLSRPHLTLADEIDYPKGEVVLSTKPYKDGEVGVIDTRFHDNYMTIGVFGRWGKETAGEDVNVWDVTIDGVHMPMDSGLGGDDSPDVSYERAKLGYPGGERPVPGTHHMTVRLAVHPDMPDGVAYRPDIVELEFDTNVSYPDD